MKIARQSDYIITPAKVLSDTEVTSLTTLCKRLLEVPSEKRNALMLFVTLECGLRATELLNLTVKDIDFAGNTVFIASLKGSNPRVLPVRGSLIKAIGELLVKRHDVAAVQMLPKDAKVFDISYNRLDQIWKMFRPNPNKTLHSLRHTFAVTTYLRTRDIVLVQTALGHRNIDNTMVYVNYVYSQGALRKAMVVGK